MKKIKIIWTKPAVYDLKNIYNFYSSKSYIAAKKLIQKIKNKPKTIQSSGFEKIGKIDDINPKYRRLIVGYYKILYRIENNQIIIIRIFDSRQNPKKLRNL